VAVAVALANLALAVMQKEPRLILACGLSTLLLGLLLSIVQRRSPLVTFPHYRPLVTVWRDVNALLACHLGAPPSFPSGSMIDILRTPSTRILGYVLSGPTIMPTNGEGEGVSRNRSPWFSFGYLPMIAVIVVVIVLIRG
jgi:hypothetical protein